MINTFNRRPLSINIPSNKDIEYKYLNQYDWKGVIDNKNFLAVDQNSFADSNNVYINEEGILKSRPSLKYKTIQVAKPAELEIDGVEDVMTLHVVKVWIFNNIRIYGTYYTIPEGSDKGGMLSLLVFYNDKFEKPLVDISQVIRVIGNMTSINITYGKPPDYKDFYFADKQNKIYDLYHLYYYDINTHTYNDASQFIYTPATKLFVNNIEAEDKGETENILTKETYFRYLYDDISKINKNLLLNKQSIPVIDKIRYPERKFSNLTPNILVGEHTALTESNYATFVQLGNGINNINYPTLQVSEKGNMILYNANANTPGKIHKSIEYSADGINFTLLPDIGKNIIGIPKISTDGNYVFCLTKNGPMVYSLIANITDASDNLTKKYPQWTNLFTALKTSVSVSWPDEFDSYQDSFVEINAHFITDDTFAIIYMEPKNNKLLKCIYAIKGNVKAITLYNMTNTGASVYHTAPNIKCRLIGDYLYIASNPIITIDMDYGSEINTWQINNYNYAVTLITNGSTNSIFTKQLNITGDSSYEVSALVNGICITENEIRIDTRPSQTGYTYTEYILTIENYQVLDILGLNRIYYAANKIICSASGLYKLDNTYLISVQDNTKEELLFEGQPIYIRETEYGAMIYILKDNVVYSTDVVKNFYIDTVNKGNINKKLLKNYCSLSDSYFSEDNSLYISEYKENNEGEYMWYFPKLKQHDFPDIITNLHPISSTEVAIFLTNEIHYCTYDNNVNAYRYFKTKIEVGCKKDSDVITTFDGKYVMFTSNRGFVALSYQQFIATTEQSLEYLSDNIYTLFDNYIKDNGIKFAKYSYYIFVYNENSTKCFILDTRNLSWWPMENMYNNAQLFVEDNIIKLISNNILFTFNTKDSYYFDNDGKLKARIRWHLKSQKLHLGAINYYKHITSITLASIHDIESLKNSQYNIQNLNLKLQVNNYRKKIDGNINDENDYKTVYYNVDIVRTYVQRLNYAKVNEFQYLLSDYNQSALNVPLSLSNITIKYKIGGQIR